MSVSNLLDAYRDFVNLRSEPPCREWLEAMDWNMSERNLHPTTFDALRHLEGIEQFTSNAEKRATDALLFASESLCWSQAYTADDFGQDFIDNYVHVELFGPNGHFANDDFAGGFVIYGPGIHYPNHWHVAEECYFMFTGGSLWGQDHGPLVEKDAGAFVFHESNIRHEMKIGEIPLLAAWWWKGGDPLKSLEY